jgi:hypothetical protein
MGVTSRVLYTGCILVLLFISNVLWADNHLPGENLEHVVFEMELDQRIFVTTPKVNFLFEAHGMFENIRGDKIQFQTRSLRAGAYFRLFKYMKLGAFYRLQAGAIHSNDWIGEERPVGSGEWQWWWKNTIRRAEHGLMVDIIIRHPLAFLPGKSWVMEWKMGYRLNGFHDDYYAQNYTQHTLNFRPGLTYFLLKTGRPILNFFLQWDLYFPLNYEPKGFYGGYVYFGILGHIARVYQLGLTIAYRKARWVTSEAFANWTTTGETYKVFHRAVILGVVSILRF